jgi:purine nucleosidase
MTKLLSRLTLCLAACLCAAMAHAADPVIFDTDVDFDDTVALAALAQQHLDGVIELRAVTITNNGAGFPGKAYQHARCLLDSLGLPNVPVADQTYALPHAFPLNLRFAVDVILDQAIPDCAAGHVPPTRSASDLLADEIQNSEGRLTIVATGPITNVATAFETLHARGAGRAVQLIDRAYVLGGAIHAGGGLEGVPGFDNTQELNVWGDPAAAQAVFAAMRPGALHLVADAVLDVPVRVDYIGTLTAAARTPSAIYVATLMNKPILIGAINAGLPVFWWDPLAALAATNPTLVDYDWLSIDVVQDGPSSGRTTESPTGVRMRVGLSSDTARFERALIDVLNGAGRR